MNDNVEKDNEQESIERIEDVSEIDHSDIERYERLLMGFCIVDKKYKLCEES